MITVKELIEVTKIISKNRGITYEEAQQETVKIRGNELLIRSILEGNQAYFNGKQEPEEPKARDSKTGEAIQADIIGEAEEGKNLPEDFTEAIEAKIEEFRERDNIEDISKITYLQWRAVCIFIGKAVQKSKVLEDKERERKEGGKIYNPDAVAELLKIYEYLCGRYNHAPSVCDFISFAGVSKEWFYDSRGQGLTSRRVEIRKKLEEVEASAQRARLLDGRGNPTSSIFYLKAKDGWTETPNETHHTIEITTKNPLPSFVLPESDGNTPFQLPE